MRLRRWLDNLIKHTTPITTALAATTVSKFPRYTCPVVNTFGSCRSLKPAIGTSTVIAAATVTTGQPSSQQTLFRAIIFCATFLTFQENLCRCSIFVLEETLFQPVTVATTTSGIYSQCFYYWNLALPINSQFIYITIRKVANGSVVRVCVCRKIS